MNREASARKDRSEALLTSRAIPINAHLPVIETAEEISLRLGDDVMRRSLCLFAVSYAALHQRCEEALRLVDRWTVGEDLSAAERAYLSSGSCSERERMQFSWRCEALIPLMWATGLLVG